MSQEYEINVIDQEPAQAEAALISDDIKAVPRVTIQIFAETQDFLSASQEAAQDRRMSRAHVKIISGGLPAAIEAYRSASTPNVLIVETSESHDGILRQLDSLAEVCDPGTKVVLVGRINDVVFYRDLIREGVSEYIVAPVNPMQLIRTVSDLYKGHEEAPIGKTIAFIGSKGGIGSSTIAHNVAWSIARDMNFETVLIDFDLSFGTVGLDFYQDPHYGIADVLTAKERIDQVFLDRVLHECYENLHILAAPASLDKTYEISESSYEKIVDLIKSTTPYVVMDIPHGWNNWIKHALYTADKIVLTTSNDLAGLRNTKNIIDTMRMMRPNDPHPTIVLNQVDMPKRPEIKPDEFAKALSIDPKAILQFDPQVFATASNNGQMISELEPNSKYAQNFRELAQDLVGRGTEQRKSKGGLVQFFKDLLN